MKFHYCDNVEILKGFYEGYTGRVIYYFLSEAKRYSYGVELDETGDRAEILECNLKLRDMKER